MVLAHIEVVEVVQLLTVEQAFVVVQNTHQAMYVVQVSVDVPHRSVELTVLEWLPRFHLWPSSSHVVIGGVLDSRVLSRSLSLLLS